MKKNFTQFVLKVHLCIIIGVPTKAAQFWSANVTDISLYGFLTDISF